MKLVWDNVGERRYETGVQNGVLYLRDHLGKYPRGVAWNGLSNVTESPSGAEPSPIYADNIKYLTLMSVEEFGATIEAYTYPDEFAECDGSAEIAPGVAVGQQTRKTFGVVYKTILGNDVDLNDFGYKLHLIYGGLASPSEKAYPTVNESPEAVTFSWEVTTTPVEVPGLKPSASIIVDSTKVSPAKLTMLENILFGTANSEARLPLPDEAAAIFSGDTPDPVALVSMVPADDATNVAVDSTIVLTFNNKIRSEVVTVASETGESISCTKFWDSTGKVLTLTPADDLDGSTVYIVTVAGVADIYGQSLAVVVNNFTTV